MVRLAEKLQQAKEDMQAKEEIISALQKECNVQREKLRDSAIIKVRSAYTQ
jgi:hypothetical protein